MIARRAFFQAAIAAGGMAVSPAVFAASFRLLPFQPHKRLYRLSRSLNRQMSDGLHVAVTRQWLLQFLPQPGGYRVEGEALATEVEVPAGLEPLAALERSRIENGPLNSALDRAGMIVGTQAANPSQPFEAAFATAKRKLGDRISNPSAHREADAALRALQGTLESAISPIAADLFAPQAESWEEQRTMPLPGGGAGSIAITYASSRDPHTGLMQQTSRRLISTVDTSSRITVETWLLD